MTDVEELLDFGSFCEFCDAAAWPLSEFEDDTAVRPDPIDRALWEQCQKIAGDRGGMIDGITVRFLDFAPLKVRYRMDAIEGSNWLRDSFIPEGEVWIDSGNAAKNFPYVLMHELHEVRLMQAGLSYDAAHRRANAVERVLRIEGGLGIETYERRMPGLNLFGKLLNQGYNLLGRRVFGLFERQRQNVVTKLRGLFVGKTGTARELAPGVASVFDPEDAAIDLKSTAYFVLEQLVINGSHVELETAAGARIRKLARLNYDVERLRPQLPVKVRRGIDEGLAEVMAQPYWQKEPEAVRDKLRQVLSQAAREGWDLETTSAGVSALLSQGNNRARAERISRTETTMALNSGLELSRRHLADLGLVVAKEWRAVDPRQVSAHPTRDSHAKAHGQRVPPHGLFVVGGETARYAGDPRLSASERINCRCLVQSIKA